MNRYLYGSVITRLIANSRATREQVLANNPGLIAAEKIAVIPNGVDIEVFDAALAKARLKPPLLPDLSNRRPLILGNAGRLNRQKGQHMLLHLAAKLLDAGIDCRVLIAGEGERETGLRELAERLALGDKVLFCGFMQDLSPFWLAIDVFVLTSLWEGFGNVVIEAGLAEKPVLAFAVSNLPELIHEGPDGNGLLFPLSEGMESLALDTRGHAAEVSAGGNCGPESEAPLTAMAMALAELAERPEKREAMGCAGRRMALRYTQEACMDAVEALLR
jgi:glycosyltransferase involved in cell wall biosynthesis